PRDMKFLSTFLAIAFFVLMLPSARSIMYSQSRPASTVMQSLEVKCRTSLFAAIAPCNLARELSREGLSMVTSISCGPYPMQVAQTLLLRHRLLLEPSVAFLHSPSTLSILGLRRL